MTEVGIGESDETDANHHPASMAACRLQKQGETDHTYDDLVGGNDAEGTDNVPVLDEDIAAHRKSKKGENDIVPR